MKKLLIILISLLCVGCANNQKLSFESLKENIDKSIIKDIAVTLSINNNNELKVSKSNNYFNLDEYKKALGLVYDSEYMENEELNEFYKDSYNKLQELFNDISVMQIETPANLPTDALYKFGFGNLGDDLGYLNIYDNNIIEITTNNGNMYYTVSDIDMEKIQKFFRDLYTKYTTNNK